MINICFNFEYVEKKQMHGGLQTVKVFPCVKTFFIISPLNI